MKTSIKHLAVLGAGIATLLGGASAKANQLIQVTVNTAPLMSDSSDMPFWLDFNWGSYSETAMTNNPVTLSNFNFGTGGAAIGGNDYISNSSGDLTASVTLNDVVSGAATTSEFSQEFTPGNTLTFTISVPTMGQPGASDGSEQFSFDILQGSTDWATANADTLNTSAPNQYDLLDVNVPGQGDVQPGSGFAVVTYQSVSPSPTGVTVAAAVPEPATYGWMGLGMIALLAFGRKARKALV